MSDTRFVVVHYHILKNGGTTLEWALERQFGSAFARLEGDSPDSILDGSDLALFLRHRPSVRAISSHQLHYPKPVERGMVIFDCCFLRHPLDRLVSLYTWSGMGDSPDPVCRAARARNPREFARYLLDEMPHMACDVQVTQIANGGAFYRPANGADLQTATAVMMDMAVPGLVEMFDESLVTAEYFLQPAFPGVRLGYVRQNVSRPGPGHRPGRERELEEKLIAYWGMDLYADLTRMNQLDLELWRRTRTELLRRMELVPEFRRRLRSFAERCAILHAAEIPEMAFAAAS